MKIKISTIARIGALLVALVNQCLAIFGKDVLPFTEGMAYQVISLGATVVIAGVNAWYDNNISKIALICGRLFDALSDGKITEDEIENLLTSAEDQTAIEAETKNNFIIKLINEMIIKIKEKK